MKVTQYKDQFYILDNGMVRAFLIVGEDHALLIDTGFPQDEIIKDVSQITDKPIEVVFTHGDRDHIGGVQDFNHCMIHKEDAHFIEGPIEITFIKDKDMISIGDYHFEVIEIPGHSYGSIALLDRNKKLLIPGDTIQKGPIYMFGEHRHLDLYMQSIEKLLKEIDDIEVILPSHNDCPITKDYISYCLEDAQALKNNELKGTPHPKMPCSHYIGKNVEFYY